MTLGVTIDQLCAAREEGRAVVAAVAYDTVGLEAIVAAGEQTGQPVIAQVGSSAFGHVDRDALIAAAMNLAHTSEVPVGVHLDHSRELDEINYCLDAGYSSVMIDGSRLAFADNVELTRQAVVAAGPYGAWVEAELGHIAGDEDRSTGIGAGTLTDPGQAATFVTETGVDALAVCIGNVHGRTRRPPALDLGLLAEIASAISVPLVLHGASGIPPDTIAEAVTLGIAKLNINADLRATYLDAVSQHHAQDDTGDDLPGALVAARRAVTEQLAEIITRHGGVGGASS